MPAILLKSLLFENNAELNSIKEMTHKVLDDMAVAAQKEYDAWKLNDDGYDEEVGGGGICHLIADELITTLSRYNIDNCTSVCSSYEQHVYVVGKFVEGVYMIDIPYHTYETGGGYSWKKIPDVKFDRSDIVVSKLDGDPHSFDQYTDMNENVVSKSKVLDNPNFKKWFGQSVLVDDIGNPSVFYHGTNRDVGDTFKSGKEGGSLGNGIYFTPCPDVAAGYTAMDSAPGNELGSNIIKVYISMQKPLILKTALGADPCVVAFVELGADKEKAQRFVEKAYDEKGYIYNQIKVRAIKQGYLIYSLKMLRFIVF